MSNTQVSEIFKAPIENVFDVLTDYKSYPDFLDGTDSVEILEMSEKGGKVKFSLNIIKEFTYVLEMKHERPHHISWKFSSGDLFKTNTGSWTLEKLDEKSTRVNYELDLAFKLLVPKMILKKLVNNNLPAMMKQYQDRVMESL